VRWAGEQVPYYRRCFREIGFDPKVDFSLEEFRRLPLLDKETVRQCGSELIAKGYSPKDMVAGATGGSTGVPVRFWLDERTRAWSDVSAEWAFGRVGFRFGNRLSLVWGANVEPQMHSTVRARVLNWLAHQQPNDCFRLSDDILDQIHSRLTTYKPEFLRCYASALTLLAQRLRHRGTKPEYPKRGIITGAEKLDAVQRETVEAVFKAPVFESYGSRDCGMMAMQLSGSDPRLFVAGANVLIEPLGDPDCVFGSEVVVTILHRPGMPFLRYRIGDYARFPSVDPGQPVEFVEEVTGRVLDHIHLPGGRLVHSTQFPHFLKDFDVKEYQVVQEIGGEVRISLVGGPNLTSENLTYIERVFNTNLSGVPLTILSVPSIERSAAGKLRPVISRYREAAPLAR
jgi:phenylacetate-CoA ligase